MNVISCVRTVGSAAALRGQPGVEVVVVSNREFPVRNELVVLRIGGQEFMLSRYPENGDIHTLIFTLTLKEFEGTTTGDLVTVYYGRGGESNERWNFGPLDKSLMDKCSPTSAPELTPASPIPSGFFPIGLYCVNTHLPYSNRIIQEFPEIARAGFTFIQSYQFEGDPTAPAGTTRAAREYLDAAYQNGLKVLMGLSVSLQDETMDQDLAHIRERVPALKDHPALFGWQLYDEPDAKKIPPKNLETAYKAIKEIDPLHPVSIATATTPEQVAPYFSGFDISMPQWLLIPLSYTIEQYKAYIAEEIQTLASLNKSTIHHVVVYNYARDRMTCPPNASSPECRANRYPTREEIRFMAYYALIQGTKGLSFNCYRFSYDESDPGDDISPSGNLTQWQAVSSVASELRSINPILLAPTEEHTGITVSGSQVEIMLKKYQDRYYLFVANPSPNAGEFEVRLNPGSFPTPRITLYPERRNITSQGGSFTDKWGPYDVRIYVISIGGAIPEFRVNSVLIAGVAVSLATVLLRKHRSWVTVKQNECRRKASN